MRTGFSVSSKKASAFPVPDFDEMMTWMSSGDKVRWGGSWRKRCLERKAFGGDSMCCCLSSTSGTGTASEEEFSVAMLCTTYVGQFSEVLVTIRTSSPEIVPSLGLSLSVS